MGIVYHEGTKEEKVGWKKEMEQFEGSENRVDGRMKTNEGWFASGFQARVG